MITFPKTKTNPKEKWGENLTNRRNDFSTIQVKSHK